MQPDSKPSLVTNPGRIAVAIENVLLRIHQVALALRHLRRFLLLTLDGGHTFGRQSVGWSPIRRFDSFASGQESDRQERRRKECLHMDIIEQTLIRSKGLAGR